jgi:phage terminase large subunit-like protein
MPPAKRTPPPETPEYPHVAAAIAYGDAVLTGEIPAGRFVHLAIKRHRRDLARAAKGWRFTFDSKKAEKVCNFVEKLPHTKGEWAQAGELLHLEGWQCFRLTCIFGWVHRDTGFRRFRKAMTVVPRKNGKSAESAAVGLYMLAGDGEHGAEVYSGATSKIQAGEVFTPAKIMANGRPDMRRFFGMVVNVSNISIPKTASKFEPLIGKPGDGASASCSIIDEYHEHQTSEQLDTMVTGMGARQQPLAWIITTAGDNISGPCYDEQLTLQKILEGSIEDDEFWGIIYTIDEGDDWTSPDVLRKANPNFGISVKADFLIARQREAMTNPRKQAVFKTKHLNVWVNSRSGYFNMQKWAECPKAPSLEDLEGQTCFLGLDLAAKVDIAALELIFPLEDGRYARHGFSYLPEAKAHDPALQHYGAWDLAGRLVVTPGDMTDYSRIEADVKDLFGRFQVEGLAYDPWQAHMLITNLVEAGVPCQEFRPLFANVSEPMKQLDALIQEGKLEHDCGPTDPMTWQMSNVIGIPDGNDNVKPAKQKPELKIDNPVALMSAMGLLMRWQADGGGQVLDIQVW